MVAGEAGQRHRRSAIAMHVDGRDVHAGGRARRRRSRRPPASRSRAWSGSAATRPAGGQEAPPGRRGAGCRSGGNVALSRRPAATGCCRCPGAGTRPCRAVDQQRRGEVVHHDRGDHLVRAGAGLEHSRPRRPRPRRRGCRPASATSRWMPGGRCQVKPDVAGGERAHDQLALGADVEQAGAEGRASTPRPAQISGAARDQRSSPIAVGPSRPSR